MSHITHEKVALVTGGGRRVGKEVSQFLAKHGFRVAVSAHHSLAQAEETASQIQSTGTEALVIVADVREEVAVRKMIKSVCDHFGRLDVLVNCAAIWLAKRLEEVVVADIRSHFEVNTLGTFLCCQHAGLAMAEQSTGGVIVNIGDWAVTRPYTDYSAYFASKGAIPAMTRSFAVELARRNRQVRVNAILPGPVMLPESCSEQEREMVVKATLVGREGQGENVAQAVLFFVDNDYVTGVCLPVDGGRTICTPWE